MKQRNDSHVEHFNPAATVTAVIFRHKGDALQVLLTLRAIAPFRDKWCLPGGHIDRFEPAYSAIVCEVYEETGLRFVGEYFGTFDEIFPDSQIHNVVAAYAGTGSGDLVREKSEVTKIQWLTLEEASQMQLAFEHNQVLNAFVSRYEVENLNDGSEGLLEEFRALRAEMSSILNARLWGTATYLLLVIGIIGGLGKKAELFHWLFLIFASIPFILHTTFRERARIRIGVYIKEKIEPHITGLDWERFIDKWRISISEGEGKSTTDKLLHMIGLGGLYVLVIAVAIYKSIESLYPRSAISSYSSIANLTLLVTGAFFAVLSVRSFFRIYRTVEDKTKEVSSGFLRTNFLEILRAKEKNL